MNESDFELNPKDFYDANWGPYTVGIDPIWNLGENKLAFINSMKMKLSVIIGIAHMTFGLFLSFLNHQYVLIKDILDFRFFHSWVDVYLVFIPQLLFLSLIFVYLCLQIIIKWIFFGVYRAEIFGNTYPGAQCAPSLLVSLVVSPIFFRLG